MLRMRPLSEADIAKIKNWPEYPDDMAQMDYALRESGWLEEFRCKQDTFLYAAEDGNDLVGFTVLSRTGAADAEFRIALRADRTGLGLGAGISAETLRLGFEVHRFSRIQLIVRKNNTRGIKLYRRLGFTERGESRKEIGGRIVDFYLMDMVSQALEKERQMSQVTRRALVVIDVQNDYVGGKLPIEYPPVELSLANIGKAMDAAKAALIPVVVVQNVLPEGAPVLAKGTPGAELHGTVTSRGWDHYVLKNLPSAFAETDLEQWLRAREVDTITVVGYMSHNCDLSTVLQGAHAGFAMEFLSDATGSLPYANRAGSASAEEIHRVVTVVMQARFAAVLGTDEWIEQLTSGAKPQRDNIFGSNQLARESRKG